MLRRLVIGVVMNFTGMQCVQSNAYLNFRQKKAPNGRQISTFYQRSN